MSDLKEPSRRYNPVEVRRRILAEGAELFARAGFAATSVDQIASAAGVTKGALYHHFSSKEEILRVLYEEYFQARIERCSSLVEASSEPFEQMSALIDEAFQNAVTSKGMLALFLRERELLARDSFSEAGELRQEFYGIFEAVVRRGQRSGCFRSDINARHATYSILGTLVWSEYWFDASRSDARRFIHDTRRLLLHGLSCIEPATPGKKEPRTR